MPAITSVWSFGFLAPDFFVPLNAFDFGFGPQLRPFGLAVAQTASNGGVDLVCTLLIENNESFLDLGELDFGHADTARVNIPARLG